MFIYLYIKTQIESSEFINVYIYMNIDIKYAYTCIYTYSLKSQYYLSKDSPIDEFILSTQQVMNCY